MSCSGFRRDVDARLLAEARRPVVQAPEQTSKVDAATKEATDAAATAAADRRKGDNSDAATAAAASATSPSTSARLSDWLRSKMNKKDGGAASAVAAAASDDREPTSAASASPSPPSASSRSSPSIGNARSGPLQRHAPPARRHSQSLLPDDDPPPMSYSGSGSASAAASAAKSNGRTAPRAAASLSSLSSASAALAADAERRLRLDRAPTAAPPTPCTLLLTNVALYLLPPSVPVEIEEAGHKRVKHFLVYNDFERIPLPDLSLVSLPYRSGLTRHGTDFALRITDFCLHLRAGESSVWLQAPRNGRSMVVESLSDAFENLTGRPLEMQQVDYAELIADVLSSAATAQQPTSPGMPAVGRIPEAVHEATSAWWASRRFVRQGYLFHRSMHVYPALAEAAESSSATAAAASSSSLSPAIELRSAPATEWVHSFVALTSDGKLMEFRSSQEFSSFAYVASAAHQGKTTGKFPSRGNCNAIDLRRASLFLRAAAANVAPDGFELVVYPRSSSMAAQPAEASASDASAGSALHSRRTLSVSSKDGIHGSAISAAAAAGGALPNQQASLEYGYTRHLFQVPLPPIPPSQLAAAAAAAAAAQGQQGLSANQRRMQQQGSSADAVAAASPPSKEHLKRLSVVEADLQAWMRALTFAMTGVAPPAVALTPLTNPGSSPARSATATDSPAASADTVEEEFDGPKPRYSLGAVSSPKSSPSQRQPQRRHEQTTAAASSIPSSSSSSSSLLAPPAFPAYSPSGSAASVDDECLSAIPISPSPEASPPLLAESPELSPVPVREPTPEPAITHDADAASAGEPVAESAATAVADSAASTAPTASASLMDGSAAVSSSSSSSSALSPDEFSATIVPPLFDTDPQSSPHGAASPLHADPVPPLP